MNPMEPMPLTTLSHAAATRRVTHGLMALATACSLLVLAGCVPAC